MKENSIEKMKNCIHILDNELKERNKTINEKEILIEKLQKENEKLKLEERSRIIGKYGEIEIHDLINKTLSNDYIPVQEVQGKIEEILNDGECITIFEGDAEFPDETTTITSQKYIKLERIQELLKEMK